MAYQCLHCHAPIPDGAKFCMNCGAPLPPPTPVCPGCGLELQPGARFCMNCGTPVNTAQVMAGSPYYVQEQPHQASAQEYQVPHQQPPVQQPWQPSTQQQIHTSATQMPQGGDIWAQQPPAQPGADPNSVWRVPAEEPAAAPHSSSPLRYLKQQTARTEDPDDMDEEAAPSRSPFKKKTAKTAKTEQPKKKKKKSFQDAANHDGYYDDQRPVDDDYADYENAGIKWLPMILGLVGIFLFAFAIIQIQLRL